jgi:hypothetical protein
MLCCCKLIVIVMWLAQILEASVCNWVVTCVQS